MFLVIKIVLFGSIHGFSCCWGFNFVAGERKMVDLSGKAAFITGGASGIGKAIGREFLKKHIKLCLADVDETSLETTVEEFRKEFEEAEIIGVTCDVTSESSFEDAVVKAKSSFGHLDILVNNAGILDEKNGKKTVEVNLIGVMIGTELGIRHLANNKGLKGGSIVNTASLVGLALFPYFPSYTASKWGVVGWSKSYGHPDHVKNTNVKVNAVCPDLTDTNILTRYETPLLNEAVARDRLSEIYHGLVLSPSDVASAFVKVLEDDVTGEALVISVRKGVYYQPCKTIEEM